jgi:hypothetical protein
MTKIHRYICRGNCIKCKFEVLSACSLILYGTKVKKGDIIEVKYIKKRRSV